ncbi:amidohydrolase family protein [Providencia manganoxydans]
MIGTFEAGKFADMIVLDRNVFEIPADDIENVNVLCTIIGGKTVHVA